MSDIIPDSFFVAELTARLENRRIWRGEGRVEGEQGEVHNCRKWETVWESKDEWG